MMKKLAFVLMLSGMAASASAAALINGAGATFPYPIYSKWFSEFAKADPNAQINYQSIGSGGGIRQFLDKTIDFGASDAPMTDEQLAKAAAPVMHIPTVLGAVVMTYNLPEAKGPLRLDGATIADIYLGKITQWNDAAIAKLNPGVKLPDTAIVVTHRSDGSGTTAVFTDYLAKASPEWKQKAGAGTAISWPTGLGGKGNEGVTGLVKQSPGSIGYVELIYAANNQLPVAEIRNKAGVFVTPSSKSVSAAAAAEAKKMPEDFRVSITDAGGKDSYPISSFTYLLVWNKMPKNEKSEGIVKFLQWALTDGQKDAEKLFYAPLPKAVAQKALAKVKAIHLE